jgi:hypothetical protein
MSLQNCAESENVDEGRQWYYFTFGWGHVNAGHFVKFFGTFSEAREKMIKVYGLAWAMQYTEDEWKEWVDRCRRNGSIWMIETELK